MKINYSNRINTLSRFVLAVALSATSPVLGRPTEGASSIPSTSVDLNCDAVDWRTSGVGLASATPIKTLTFEFQFVDRAKNVTGEIPLVTIALNPIGSGEIKDDDIIFANSPLTFEGAIPPANSVNGGRHIIMSGQDFSEVLQNGRKITSSLEFPDFSNGIVSVTFDPGTTRISAAYDHKLAGVEDPARVEIPRSASAVRKLEIKCTNGEYNIKNIRMISYEPASS